MLKGFDIEDVKKWRKEEYDAGRPSEIHDYFYSHGGLICPHCGLNTDQYA